MQIDIKIPVQYFKIINQSIILVSQNLEVGLMKQITSMSSDLTITRMSNNKYIKICKSNKGERIENN